MTQLTLCPRCGEENDSKQSYCRPCMSAYKKARREAKQPTIACGTCTASFVKTRSRQLYCSESCKREALNASRRVRPTTADCLQCGAAFSGRSDKRFCSERCVRSAWLDAETNRADRNLRRLTLARMNRPATPARPVRQRTPVQEHRELWRRNNRFRVAANSERSRAKQLGVEAVDFTFDELRARFSMWGMRCWMCGVPATSIDHVKPLAANGPHMLSNLRPACKLCNSSKHARWFGVSKLSLFMRA